MPKPLLDVRSPKYLRRLVRQINALQRMGLRLYANDAITRHKTLLGTVHFNGRAIWVSHSWCLDPETIVTDLGQLVCASRRP